MFIRIIAILVSLAFFAAFPADTQALDKVERVCAAAKLKATGKKVMSKLKCETKAVLADLPSADTECLTKAEEKFSLAFAKAEAKGGCVSDGDASPVEGAVDSFVATEVIRQRTGVGPLPSCPAYLMPCGSCGSGLCVNYSGGGLVCISTVGAVPIGCTSDAECTSPHVCVNAGTPACATPCP